MTPRQEWLFNQSSLFLRGYDAACSNEPKDRTRPAEWLRGYEEAMRDLDASDL